MHFLFRIIFFEEKPNEIKQQLLKQTHNPMRYTDRKD